MKTEKMSFKNIKDVLSRDEMKGIMAGSGSGGRCGICLGAPGGGYCHRSGSGGSCKCFNGSSCPQPQ
jgi:hypothetical protein